jgi:tripartite-type tricarboxylate transporter receptor subunit TctC
MIKVHSLAAVVAILLTPWSAAAQGSYPAKPVTFVIGFAPGGPSDVMARLLSRKLEEHLKQPVIIENKPGAGGGIAGTQVARAAPDGYTVLIATGSILAINPSLYKNPGYDPVKDFEPITMLGTQTSTRTPQCRQRRSRSLSRTSKPTPAS